MEHAVDFGGFRACFGESTSYGFQHTMSEPTRERITHLRANGLLLDHHGIPPSGADNVSDEEWQALCDMALRSLSSPSATGAISKEMIWKIACIETNQTTIGGKPVVGTDAAEKIATMLSAAPAPASAIAATSEFVSVPREPTEEMWDAAWKSIGLPYRAKLSLHEIKTLFDKFHAAMLSAAPAPAAQDTPGNVCPRRTICTEQDCKYPACRYGAPAPAEPVDVLVLQESIKALDEVNTAWFNELEEIKKIVGYVPAECKQTLTRYIKGIVEKATSPVVEAGAINRTTSWPRVWGVGRMYDNEKAVLVALDRKPTDDELRAIDDYLKGAQ